MRTEPGREKGRILVFTGVFGKPDALHEPVIPLPDVPLVCWTDMAFQGETAWRMVHVRMDALPPVKRNRKVKIFFPPVFERYEYSLYTDSTVILRVDPRDLISFLDPGSDICVFRHPARDCLYDEAEEVIRRGLDDPDVVRRQVSKYRDEGVEPHAGLWAGTVILRRHTRAMREFSEGWWREVELFSCRDQISFPYVARRLGVKVSIFPGNLLCNDFFEWRPWDRRGKGWVVPSP